MGRLTAVGLLLGCWVAGAAGQTCEDLATPNQCCGTSAGYTAPNTCETGSESCRANNRCYGSRSGWTAPDTCETGGNQCRADDRCYGTLAVWNSRTDWTAPDTCTGAANQCRANNQCYGSSALFTTPDTCTGSPPTPTSAGNQCRANNQCYGSSAQFTTPDTCTGQPPTPTAAGNQCRANNRCYGSRSDWTAPNSCDISTTDTSGAPIRCRPADWTAPNTCDANDGTHVCGQLATCPAPTWRNTGMDRVATVTPASAATLGQSRTASCPNTHESVVADGDGQLTCTSGGAWAGSISCHKKCDPPTWRNSGMDRHAETSGGTGSLYTSTQTVTIGCKTGFRTDPTFNDQQLACQLGGVWVGTLVCVPEITFPVATGGSFRTPDVAPGTSSVWTPQAAEWNLNNTAAPGAVDNGPTATNVQTAMTYSVTYAADGNAALIAVAVVAPAPNTLSITSDWLNDDGVNAQRIAAPLDPSATFSVSGGSGVYEWTADPIGDLGLSLESTGDGNCPTCQVRLVGNLEGLDAGEDVEIAITVVDRLRGVRETATTTILGIAATRANLVGEGLVVDRVNGECSPGNRFGCSVPADPTGICASTTQCDTVVEAASGNTTGTFSFDVNATEGGAFSIVIETQGAPTTNIFTECELVEVADVPPAGPGRRLLRRQETDSLELRAAIRILVTDRYAGAERLEMLDVVTSATWTDLRQIALDYGLLSVDGTMEEWSLHRQQRQAGVGGSGYGSGSGSVTTTASASSATTEPSTSTAPATTTTSPCRRDVELLRQSCPQGFLDAQVPCSEACTRALYLAANAATSPFGLSLGQIAECLASPAVSSGYTASLQQPYTTAELVQQFDWYTTACTWRWTAPGGILLSQPADPAALGSERFAKKCEVRGTFTGNAPFVAARARRMRLKVQVRQTQYTLAPGCAIRGGDGTGTDLTLTCSGENTVAAAVNCGNPNVLCDEIDANQLRVDADVYVQLFPPIKVEYKELALLAAGDQATNGSYEIVVGDELNAIIQVSGGQKPYSVDFDRDVLAGLGLDWLRFETTYRLIGIVPEPTAEEAWTTESGLPKVRRIVETKSMSAITFSDQNNARRYPDDLPYRSGPMDCTSAANGPEGQNCYTMPNECEDNVLFDNDFLCECRLNETQGNNCEPIPPAPLLAAATPNQDTVTIPVVVSAFVVLAGMVILVMVVRQRKLKQVPHDFEAQLTQMINSGAIKLADKTAPRRIPQELNRGHITLLSVLGKGEFGEVMKGFYVKEGEDHSEGRLVALKTLKGAAGDQVNRNEKETLMAEATINAQFDHINIVNLLGVVTAGQPLMIVLELCPRGELKQMVKKKKVPLKTKIHMIYGVAKGMEYLCSLKFIHRDLAARNVLVDAQKNVRISTRDLAALPHLNPNPSSRAYRIGALVHAPSGRPLSHAGEGR